MNALVRRCGVAVVLGLAACLAVAAEPEPKPSPPKAPPAKAPPAPKALPPLTEFQDFVFLTEARPVLLRLYVRAKGRPILAVWDEFMKHLFAYLDVNGDGVLSKEEAERVPDVTQLLSGSFGAFIGAAAGKRDALDADKDGKVTPAELAAYYRRSGYTPYQIRLNPNDNAAAQLAYLGGPKPEPEVALVARSVFNRLDADNDGKLTREELVAAPAVLLKLDENEDEIVTTQEMVPDAKPPSLVGAAAGMMMNAGKSSAGNNTLVPVTVPGEAPAELVKRLHERYDPRGSDKNKEKTLSRKDLGLDEATFARLDANKDGVLNDAELAGFVKRPPDLCLTVYFAGDEKQAPVELMPAEAPSPLAGKVRMHDGMLGLDLGAARAELRRGEDSDTSRFFDIVRPQLIAQFKGADADGNGYVDKEEVKKSPFIGNLFKMADRDGDGKLTEKEFVAYLDNALDLQKRASEACATVVLRDQSRGLFDLLDANRDKKLSVREMRQAPKLLDEIDRGHKGYIVRGDVPRNYLLTVRRGASSAGEGQEAVFARLYGGGGYKAEEPAGRGPAWFRKMDRNRDGDVSRKEFLFGDEQFNKLDADGDGLISAEEAEKASASK